MLCAESDDGTKDGDSEHGSEDGNNNGDDLSAAVIDRGYTEEDDRT
jgi:hypothetical protein